MLEIADFLEKSTQALSLSRGEVLMAFNSENIYLWAVKEKNKQV